MPLLNFDKTLTLLRDYRTISIVGHPGSFKTSLAFRIAWELYQHDMIDRVFSNCRSVWSEDLDKFNLDSIKDITSVRACIILDEGGQFLEDRHDAKPFMAFTRKLDCYVIVASAYPPTLKMRTVLITVDQKYTRVGFPMLRYRVMLEDVATTSSFTFNWYNPAEVFGIYDTSTAPVDADEVAALMGKAKDRLVFETTGKKYVGSRAAAGGRQVIAPIALDAPDTSSATAALDDAADHLGLKVAALQRLEESQKRSFWGRLLGRK